MSKVQQFRTKSSKEYFFGFGADQEVDMIAAIIGRQPRIVGVAVLEGYQLCIQSLEDITDKRANPRAILERTWGKGFRSYAIRPVLGSKVRGTVFEVTKAERLLIDAWELVPEGWQDSAEVTVVGEDGHVYKAYTQVLAKGQREGDTVNGMMYRSWLMPKEDFVRIAPQAIQQAGLSCG
ncbi:MAG: gamma-glutamylcyclotransferase family protein [Candidatus Saccharimonas sp.]